MSTPDLNRVPAGVPAGGQFVVSDRDEAPVALEVEFATDEAEQVDRALEAHAQALAAEEHVQDPRTWDTATREAWTANQSARAALAGLRVHLYQRPVAQRAFSPDEVKAMTRALDFHRSHVRSAGNRRALDAAEAARFRIDIAEPLVRETHDSTDLVTEPAGEA